MSEKLISANDVLKYTVLAGEIRNQYMEVVPAYFVREAPTMDAVEVVRCGECWHRFTGHFGMMCIGRPNDFFCANGERRKENDRFNQTG